MMVRSRMSLVTGLACLLGISVLSSCTTIYPVNETYRRGPWLQDPLIKGSQAAVVDEGEFTGQGWQAGSEGTLVYDLPAMTQGDISFDVRGLDRNAATTNFFTLFEQHDSMYADPYVIYNPYLVTVALKNFDQAPRSPFDFQWSAKTFPTNTPELDRYIPGLPQGAEAESYLQTVASDYLPIYPDQTYHIRVKWMNGLSQLFVNNVLLAEHHYRPVLYNPLALRLVLGRTPGQKQPFPLPELVFSNVRISFSEK